MANLLLFNISCGRVATFSNKLHIYIHIYLSISKLQKSSSSVAFIRKVLHNNIKLSFAKIKENTNTKSSAEKYLMRGHINKHYNDIR